MVKTVITYDIIVTKNRNSSSPLKKDRAVAPSDPDFKQVVLQRNLNQNHFQEGARVKIRKSAERGVVEKVIGEINDINWVNDRPMFLQVKFDSGKVMMLNPSQLKRSKL